MIFIEAAESRAAKHVPEPSQGLPDMVSRNHAGFGVIVKGPIDEEIIRHNIEVLSKTKKPSTGRGRAPVHLFFLDDSEPGNLQKNAEVIERLRSECFGSSELGNVDLFHVTPGQINDFIDYVHEPFKLSDFRVMGSIPKKVPVEEDLEEVEPRRWGGARNALTALLISRGYRNIGIFDKDIVLDPKNDCSELDPFVKQGWFSGEALHQVAVAKGSTAPGTGLPLFFLGQDGGRDLRVSDLQGNLLAEGSTRGLFKSTLELLGSTDERFVLKGMTQLRSLLTGTHSRPKRRFSSNWFLAGPAEQFKNVFFLPSEYRREDIPLHIDRHVVGLDLEEHRDRQVMHKREEDAVGDIVERLCSDAKGSLHISLYENILGREKIKKTLLEDLKKYDEPEASGLIRHIVDTRVEKSKRTKFYGLLESGKLRTAIRKLVGEIDISRIPDSEIPRASLRMLDRLFGEPVDYDSSIIPPPESSSWSGKAGRENWPTYANEMYEYRIRAYMEFLNKVEGILRRQQSRSLEQKTLERVNEFRDFLGQLVGGLERKLDEHSRNPTFSEVDYANIQGLCFLRDRWPKLFGRLKPRAAETVS